jgi:hypothetical protein
MDGWDPDYDAHLVDLHVHPDNDTDGAGPIEDCMTCSRRHGVYCGGIAWSFIGEIDGQCALDYHHEDRCKP